MSRVPIKRIYRVRLTLVSFGVLALALSGEGSSARRAAGRAPTLSAKSVRLRVMTYNIHVGVGMDKRLDLARVAEVIKYERPDLVGLQEVDRGVERTGRRDEIAELARMVGMEYAFAPNLNFQGGWYGVAVLSHFPILATDHRRYANRREAERRGFIRAEVDAGGQRVNFVTTHLDYQHDGERLFETGQLMRALEQVTTPLIVVGDLNDEPSGSSYRLMLTRFEDAWTESGADERGLTFPSDKATKRIDYVFFSKGSAVRAKRAWVPSTQASDHLPLVADLELR
jgi:endonuclease/exonuclease/phosphatase family metal-dependent hydrolase